MHKCYLPENKGRLSRLRELEALQKQGKLKQGAYFEMLALKEKLGIGR
jgi:hypothetical protein